MPSWPVVVKLESVADTVSAPVLEVVTMHDAHVAFRAVIVLESSRHRCCNSNTVPRVGHVDVVQGDS